MRYTNRRILYFTSGHPSAAGRAWEQESSPVKDQRSDHSATQPADKSVDGLSCVDAPKITVAPSDKKVKENQPVTLYCRASGHPTPDVFWRRAGRRITGNHERYTVVTVQQGGAAVLRIEPAKPRRDEMEFECVAENGVGDPATASANIEVYPEERGKRRSIL